MSITIAATNNSVIVISVNHSCCMTAWHMNMNTVGAFDPLMNYSTNVH